jgi:hypothetical protein
MGLFFAFTSDMRPGMAIDHRLHFFGMHLQTADIDDPVAPSRKVVAAIPQFKRVACIDKAFGILRELILCAKITEAVRCGANSQRAVLHFHIDLRITAEQLRGKAHQPSFTSEAHARLRRSEGMRDTCLRVLRLDLVQNGLVDNLSGHADVFRRDAGQMDSSARRRQWEGVPEICVTPMCAGACKKIRCRLLRARQAPAKCR